MAAEHDAVSTPGAGDAPAALHTASDEGPGAPVAQADPSSTAAVAGAGEALPTPARRPLKLVLTLRPLDDGGYRALIALGADGCDPLLHAAPAPDPAGALALVPPLLAEAEARWGAAPSGGQDGAGRQARHAGRGDRHGPGRVAPADRRSRPGVAIRVGEETIVRRIFVYDGREFPDPSPDLTVEDVRRQLAEFFPELVNADTREERRGDEEMRYTFSRRIGTKGSTAAGRAVRRALRRVPARRLAVFDLAGLLFGPDGRLDAERAAGYLPQLALAQAEADAYAAATRRAVAALRRLPPR